MFRYYYRLFLAHIVAFKIKHLSGQIEHGHCPMNPFQIKGCTYSMKQNQKIFMNGTSDQQEEHHNHHTCLCMQAYACLYVCLCACACTYVHTQFIQDTNPLLQLSVPTRFVEYISRDDTCFSEGGHVINTLLLGHHKLDIN